MYFEILILIFLFAFSDLPSVFDAPGRISSSKANNGNFIIFNHFSFNVLIFIRSTKGNFMNLVQLGGCIQRGYGLL